MRLLPAVGWVRLLLAVSGALVSPNRTNAQLPTLNEQNTRAVVDTLARLLEQLYVYPDTGRMIGERLRRRQIDGVYATETSLRGFASRLTADMRSINGDSHLYVDLVPFGQSVGADRSTPADLDRAARAANYGFERVERLAGNVGYLRMNGFSSRDGALEAATAALRFLAQTDAVIIDLRNSVGGSAYLVRFLISHFTGPDTVQTVAVFDRSTGTTTAVWTLPTVPGPRRPDVPLYVLTDHITRSAGEGFSFSLQNLRRATIVGERTAGAGHNNAVVPLGNGLQASISFTRVFEPATGREWEHVGVTPDIEVPGDSALRVAHVDAVRRMANRADGVRRAELTAIRDELTAKDAAQTVPVATLRQYAGNYGGGGIVAERNGRLRYAARPALPWVNLVHLSNAEFVAAGTRYIFDMDNGVPRLLLAEPGREPVAYVRLRTEQR